MAGATRVCALDELTSGEARRFAVEGRQVAVVRIDDDVYALGDTCSHADVSLSEGDVLSEEREIECWKHGSTFSLLDGEPQCLPAVRPVPVYRARVEGGDVLVEVEGEVDAEVEVDADVHADVEVSGEVRGG